ncbi:MAG: SGNH/GDSL hydrolase family protein [Balneolaceae bacterium]|nr:SGNH/GDSL hydrolase family protein [Balneolaceae bacterium]
MFVFIGCASTNPEKNNAPKSTFLALGDSYTIGESVPENERWPVQLVNQLNENGYNFADPSIIATTGWTTAELQEGIAEVNPTHDFDLVSILIGVNNQYRGYDFEIYRKELPELLSQAIAFAGDDTSRVFMVSIPNYGVTPFGQSRGEDKIRAELLEYDQFAAALAEQHGIPFFNITPISEKAKTDASYIASDQLHPSGKMYREWVELMLPEVINIIERQ